jgi:hypothetical protein
MRRWVALTFACLATAFASKSARAAAPPEEPLFREYLAGLVEAGTLDFDEAMLARFQRVFAPDDLPSPLRGPGAWPTRSATMLIDEYRRLRDGLPPAVTSVVDGYLAGPASAAAAEHVTTHFRIGYDVSGPDAVDPADVLPANGIPDYVEHAGTYLETAWSRLFDEAGFRRPVSAGAHVPVSFREMSAFGYTHAVAGGTRIVLHRSFAGFPANQDPDGSARGALKVTTAHELKHASQWIGSGWSEGGWLEADATWAEDFVHDATNDYVRYLPYGSPVSHPDGWISAGGASYEDCLWQRLLEETLGAGVLVDFFEARALDSQRPVPETFDAVLRQRGSSLGEAVRALAAAAYFCGANAPGRPLGFEEADSYPTPPIAAHLVDPATALGRSLAGMSTHFVLVGGPDRAGQPWIQFLGGAAPFSVGAFTLDTSGRRAYVQIPVTGSNTSSFELSADWSEIVFLVLAVSNGEAPRAGADYFLTVDDRNAVGAGSLPEEPVTLWPARPNPFRDATTIAFSVSRPGPVRLAVYDVGGRLVRRLLEADRLGAGVHERVWDGVDDAGRLAAPGVYYYRLDSAGDDATRKMLLLR